MSKSVTVQALPRCDMCWHYEGVENAARYDGKTRMGPWANMCASHFSSYGCGLGTGQGQELVLASEVS